MKNGRTVGASLVCGVAVMVVGCGASGQRADDGVFTAAQAERGAAVYAEHCASCHGTELSGGAAPALTGAAFQTSWSHPNVTLDDMFFLQRTTMPPRASSTLSASDQAAAFAYLLERNGYTPGTTAVAAGAPGLVRPPRWVGVAGSTAPEAPTFIPGAPGAAPAASGPDQATLSAAETSSDWLHHTHDYSGTRFSTLDQITSANVDQLAPVCSFTADEAVNFQSGPIVYDEVMFVTTSNETIAIDAATCVQKWRHTWTPLGHPGWWRNRGVAIKDGRVVRGTPDGYLLSLNAETGAQLWARRVAISEAGETFSMAPMLFEDLIIIGPAGSENNIQGWVGAFRLEDGSPVWRFNTVPRPGEPGYDTWQNPEGIPMGGGSVWTAFSLDPDTGDMYLAVANPSPDLPVQLRRGDNLYTNSLVALDVRTGAFKWHHAFVPNDSHDWDLTHASPLVTTTIGGASRRLVVTAGKDGFVRALDRASHEIVFETAVTTIENAEIPVTTTPTRACPGVLGGVQWNGPAYHPGTGLVYVPAVDWCGTFTAFDEARYIPGKNYLGGSVQLDAPERAQGWLTAVDVASGEVRWRYRSARPMLAAATATAGNLVLTGEVTGDVVAFDAETGDERFRYATGNPIGGGVVTYAAGGRQYVAVVGGRPSNFWTPPDGAGTPTVYVFGLP